MPKATKKAVNFVPQGTPAAEVIPKLKPIVLPELKPPPVLAVAPKLLPAKFKPFYLKGDADIHKDIEKKFTDAIDLFAASGKDAISDNMIRAANFSDDLQKKLTAAKGKKSASPELVEFLNNELRVTKIIPREPRQEPFKAEEPAKKGQPPKRKAARKKQQQSKGEEKPKKKR